MTPKHTDYIRKLAGYLEKNECPENIAPMRAYLKYRFEFFGLRAPFRRALFKEFFAADGRPDMAGPEKSVLGLFDLPEREFHYFAIEPAGKFKKGIKPRNH